MAISFPIQFFDPDAQVAVWEGRRLPHWCQAGTICFATWRTWDSIPQEVLLRWRLEREAWLVKLGIDPHSPDWKEQVRRLPRATTIEHRRMVAERWEQELDRCHGLCPLRDADCSEIVANSLMKFDGDRYVVLDYVIMPNHVHLLAAFASQDAMISQFESWKHFSAVQINRWLKRSGRFWQVEDFDHLVRHEEQFQYLRRYIAENPRNANLKFGEYRHYSKDLTK
jgi:putative transposase